jgi:GNAT superfamily N-acetyltransferase
MPKGELIVRLAEPEEAGDIAALYAVCHPESVWSQMGAEVGEVYFRRFCVGPHELGVTARRDGVLVGACVGTGRPDAYSSRFYRDYAAPLATAVARETLRRPSVALVVARRLAIRGRRLLAAVVALIRGGGPRAERLRPDLPLHADGTCFMAAFFVSPGARGRRLGTVMLQRFADEMAERGYEWCRVLTTDDNVASQVAQRRAGFECVARRGRNLTYVRRIGPGPS